MYAVSTKTLKTDKGKSMVRIHADDYDAQSIHAEMYDYAQCSTKASVEASYLLTYITTSRLGTGAWKGSTESYIIHWQNQIRKYEQLVDANDCFSDAVKGTMLKNSVHSVDDLWVVKAQADQFQVRMGSKITYEQYCSLLQSASQTYDAQFETKVNSKGMRHSVYDHHIYDSHDSAYNIDSDLHLLQEPDYDHGIGQGIITEVNYARLNLQQWNKLSNESKHIWDTLDNESKRIIPEFTKLPDRQRGQRGPTHSQNSASDRKVQFHDLEGDMSNGTVDQHPDVFHDAIAEQPTCHTLNDDCTILANMKKCHQLPPGHLQWFLSSSLNANQAKEMAPTKTKDIILDGKHYREVAMCNIRYCHSHSRIRRGTLVDRGANGGICGEDVRIIHKSGRIVDVQGIDNHQVVDVPIVTAGAIISTQHGRVILILNQYAYIGNGKTIHSSGKMEIFGNEVNDKSMKVPGGLQCITTEN